MLHNVTTKALIITVSLKPPIKQQRHKN